MQRAGIMFPIAGVLVAMPDLGRLAKLARQRGLRGEGDVAVAGQACTAGTCRGADESTD